MIPPSSRNNYKIDIKKTNCQWDPGENNNVFGEASFWEKKNSYPNNQNESITDIE